MHTFFFCFTRVCIILLKSRIAETDAAAGDVILTKDEFGRPAPPPVRREHEIIRITSESDPSTNDRGKEKKGKRRLAVIYITHRGLGLEDLLPSFLR